MTCQRSSDRLIKLCLHFGSSRYLSGIAARELHRFGTVYGGRYRGDLAQLRPSHLFASALLPYLLIGARPYAERSRDSLAVLSSCLTAAREGGCGSLFRYQFVAS